MIVRAVERGVPEEKIAKALNVNVASIVRKRTLLDGICEEATDLLKDKMVSGKVFGILKRMKAFRQIECADAEKPTQRPGETQKAQRSGRRPDGPHGKRNGQSAA